MHSYFQNKISSLLANELTSTIVRNVKTNKQHGTIADEATNVSNETALSLAHRTTDDDFNEL